MNGAKLSAAVFFLSVFFCVTLFCHRNADAFVLKPDPFGFPPEDSTVSAYSLGPFLRIKDGDSSEIAFRPLFYLKRNNPAGFFSADILYPLFHYRKQSPNFQAGFLFNLISFGRTVSSLSGSEEKDFKIYPLLFYRYSEDPARKRFALVPFYGNFGEKIKFVLFPLYLRTRSHDSVSHNVLWPVFAFYSGGRKGFRFWPFFGKVEEKNHRSRFLLWPFYFERTNYGKVYSHYKAFFPFYYRFDYLTESHKIYLWPLFQKSVDPARNLESFHLPWPFVNFKKSDTEKRIRFFPLFETSQRADIKKTSFFLWPLYESSRINFNTHEHLKKKFLLILKIRREKPFDKTRNSSLQIDFWPVFSYKKDERGSSYLHMLSPLEPFIGSSDKLYRNYSFLWRLIEVRRKKGRGTSVSALFGTLMFRKSCEESSFYILGKALGYASDLNRREIRFLFLPVKIAGPSKSKEDCGK